MTRGIGAGQRLFGRETSSFLELRALGTRVQGDVVRDADVQAAPEQFLAVRPEEGVRLADWLTPLVVETDGTVVPMTYGFPRSCALGNAAESSLADLAAAWDPYPFLSLCSRVAQDLLDRGSAFFNWYEEVCPAAGSVGTPLSRATTS